jgi:cobalt/nickel transport system permease protein
MKLEAFSEDLSGKDGRIRGMDARAKLLFTLLCLVVSITATDPKIPIFIGGLSLLLLIIAGTPPKALLFRLSAPLLMASLMAVFQCFLAGGKPLFHIGILGYSLTASSEGLVNGLHIIFRVFGATSAMLFLTMTTPAHRLLSAAAWLKAPRGLVELSLITYRYVFVLIEDAVTVYHAQKIRLCYAAGPLRSLQSLGTLTGTVLLRAYAQAEATGASMALRGYTGEYLPSTRESFRAFDALFLCLSLSSGIGLYIWTR